MRNIKLVVEYDGTDYSGFQRIPGRRTIQGELEWTLSRLTKESVRIVGAGRTDAGAHALGQVVSFWTKGTIPIDKLPVAMNSELPRDIVVREAVEESAEFHARFSAKSRSYEYRILNSDMPGALVGRFAWFVPFKFDLDTMRTGAECLIGAHDFTSFSMRVEDAGSRTRVMTEFSIERDGELIKFTIAANAFLHSMARILVGTLVEVGQGRRKAADIKKVLEAKDRRLAGRMAPAKGLVLMGVKY
jgi:tRNA pseudouridine38-40 synthase